MIEAWEEGPLPDPADVPVVHDHALLGLAGRVLDGALGEHLDLVAMSVKVSAGTIVVEKLMAGLELEALTDGGDRHPRIITGPVEIVCASALRLRSP
jgi:hypothetical protein